MSDGIDQPRVSHVLREYREYAWEAKKVAEQSSEEIATVGDSVDTGQLEGYYRGQAYAFGLLVSAFDEMLRGRK